MAFETDTDYPAGCIVEMLCPIGDPTVEVNGQAGESVVREQHGARWLYVAMPAGRARAAISGA